MRKKIRLTGDGSACGAAHSIANRPKGKELAITALDDLLSSLQPFSC